MIEHESPDWNVSAHDCDSSSRSRPVDEVTDRGFTAPAVITLVKVRLRLGPLGHSITDQVGTVSTQGNLTV